MPYFHTCKAELKLETGILKLHEKADYPFTGNVVFQCLENTAGAVTLRFFAPDEWGSGAASSVWVNGEEQPVAYENGFVSLSVDLNSGDEVVLDSEMKFSLVEGNECINNSKDHFSFRHGPMMLGVHSVLENETADAVEVQIPCDAEMKPLGAGRYETKTADGQSVVLQPMWGKENLIEPLDVYQVLFKK